MAKPDHQDWYKNTSRYPDITLVLHSACDKPNPRQYEIRIHRAIICPGNDYIESVIGHNGPLGAHARIVHIHDDVLSEITETVARHAYGFPLPEAASKQWKTWLSMGTGGLVLNGRGKINPILKEHAMLNFKRAAIDQAHASNMGLADNVDEILEATKSLRDLDLHSFTAMIRGRRAATLGQNEDEPDFSSEIRYSKESFDNACFLALLEDSVWLSAVKAFAPAYQEWKKKMGYIF